MSSDNDACPEFNMEPFSGIVRLFPIPDLVLFPHILQPLHVFEERYCELMEDALAGDHLIGIPVLRPGWEIDYASRPPLKEWACLGRIVVHHRLEDGCYNLMLAGVGRMRIQRELPPRRSFRQAEVTLVNALPETNRAKEAGLFQQLMRHARQHLGQCDCPATVRQILKQRPPLEQVTDLLAYALPLPPEVRYRLLAEVCPYRRAQLLISQLQEIPLAPYAESPAVSEMVSPFSPN